MQLAAIDGIDAHSTHYRSLFAFCSISHYIVQTVLSLSVHCHFVHGSWLFILVLFISEQEGLILICLLAGQAFAVQFVLIALTLAFALWRLLFGHLGLASSTHAINGSIVSAYKHMAWHVGLIASPQRLT